MTGPQKKNSRTFKKKKKKIHVEHKLAEACFLKKSYNPYVNLYISIHLMIINNGQPSNTSNVKYAAITDEVHTYI